MVDRCAEYTHLRRQAHVSIYQRRHVDAEFTNLLVQYLVVILEIIVREKRSHLLYIHISLQRIYRSDQLVCVREMRSEEV